MTYDCESCKYCEGEFCTLWSDEAQPELCENAAIYAKL